MIGILRLNFPFSQRHSDGVAFLISGLLVFGLGWFSRYSRDFVYGVQKPFHRFPFNVSPPGLITSASSPVIFPPTSQPLIAVSRFANFHTLNETTPRFYEEVGKDG